MHLDSSWSKTASLYETSAGFHQHIPSRYLVSSCNVMGLVWSLQDWLTGCIVYYDKSAFTPTTTTPNMSDIDKNKHILHLLQVLAVTLA